MINTAAHKRFPHLCSRSLSPRRSNPLSNLADRRVDVERLFTHRWKLEQAEEAYRLFDTQTTGKAVILPT
jgi:threonine dehydrogenase-like Zn-dependent dehydrogenase